MRVAFLTPLPPARTGVADYAAALIPELGRWVELDIFSDDSLAARVGGSPVFPVSEFPRRARTYDARLYQIGNSAHYGTLLGTMLKYPGAVTLHDGTLHHLYVDATLHRGDAAGYVRELTYAHGAEGYAAAQAVIGGAFLYPFYRFPLVKRAVDAATAVVAHSEGVGAAAKQARPGVRVERIEHFAFPAPPPRGSPRVLQRKHRIPEGAWVVAAFGPLAYPKRAEVTLRAFARWAGRDGRAFFVWVGAGEPGRELGRLVGELGIAGRVRFTGRVDEATLYDYLRLTDAAVNLRFPTAGEASGIVMRLAAVGVPCVVTRAGWYAELPVGVTLAVAPGEGEVEGVAHALARLAGERGLREEMGERGRAMARERTVERAAQEYVRFLKEQK